MFDDMFDGLPLSQQPRHVMYDALGVFFQTYGSLLTY